MHSIKEIYERLETCTDDTAKVELLADLSAAFLHVDVNRCMEVVEQLGELAEARQDPKAFGYHYSGLGRIYYKQSRFAESLVAFQTAVSYAQKANSPMLESNCYHSMGMVYWKEGNFDESLNMALKALEFFNDLPDKTGNKAMCYNSLGNIYERMGDYDKAEQAYLEGMAVLEQLSEDRMVYNVKGNLGVIKLRKQQYAEALKYLKPVYQGFKKLKHTTGEALTLVHIGQAHVGLKEYAKGMECYQQALKMVKQNEFKFTEADAHRGLGSIYMAMQGPDEALKHYEKALEIVKSIEYHSGVCDCYLDFVDVYLAKGDPTKALMYANEGLELAYAKKLPNETRKLEAKRNELLGKNVQVA